MTQPTRLLLAALAAAALAAPATAGAAVRISHSGPQLAFKPGEVVVQYKSGRTRLRHARADETTLQAAARLARAPHVKNANPNWVARAAAFIPNDPGDSGVPGAWQQVQWNFMPEVGVDAPTAWDHLNAVGRPGGKGVLVAVLDTGVAYKTRGPYRRSPDLAPGQFARGYDFVDEDGYPHDVNGHGTHVASTIAEAADNGIALTGLAYGAKILPVRVLDRLGEGDSRAIARGIRFAARRGAKIINLSFEFGSYVTAREIPEILSALRYATRRGSLVVAAAGNDGAPVVAYPARATNVLSVGATTEFGCLSRFSSSGSGLDIVAPGGGRNARMPGTLCRRRAQGRYIRQMTFANDRTIRRFGLPTGYEGTSMAAPHVSATAALVIASGVLGPNPAPAEIERRLEETATDLGEPGFDSVYGHGRVNAGRATAPAPAPAPPPA